MIEMQAGVLLRKPHGPLRTPDELAERFGKHRVVLGVHQGVHVKPHGLGVRVHLGHQVQEPVLRMHVLQCAIT